MYKTKKVAIIGCGSIAKNAHIPSYMAIKGVEIKYFCDIIKSRADDMVEKYSIGKSVVDYRDILDDPELDAVSVCTPNNVHMPITIDFLRNGKHVLCEKPISKTLEDSLLMQKVQHETGKVLNIGVVNRYNGAVNKIKDLIEEGILGNIYHVYISFRSHRCIPGLGKDFTNREISGGGVLIDWGVHFIDIVMYCCGDPVPLTVSSKAFSVLGCDMENYVYEGMWAGPPDFNGKYDVDDFITGFVRTKGPTFTLNGAWAQNIGEDEMFIDFMGDKAGIRLQYGKDFKVYTTKAGKLMDYMPEHDNVPQYQAEIEGFLHCIDTGEKSPSHIDTVTITAKILQALYDSSEAGKEIELSV